MLELKFFTITILVLVCLQCTEGGLVMRPTRAFSDVLNMGRREHLMTRSFGNIGRIKSMVPGQVPGSLRQRRPLVGLPKIGIEQHLPRLPRGYTPSRYRPRPRPQQRPYQPRNIFRENQDNLTTSTIGPILRINEESGDKDSPDSDTHSDKKNNGDSEDKNPPNNPDEKPTDPKNRIRTTAYIEPEPINPIDYTGKETKSTIALYKHGEEPQAADAKRQMCENAQCSSVLWKNVEDN